MIYLIYRHKQDSRIQLYLNPLHKNTVKKRPDNQRSTKEIQECKCLFSKLQNKNYFVNHFFDKII